MPTIRESLSQSRFGLVPIPLLARQEVIYRRLLAFALLGLAPIVVLRVLVPLPNTPATGFFVGFVGSFAVAAMAMRRSPRLLGASVVLGAIACAIIRFTWATNINVWLGGFGIGAMLVLALAFLGSGPEERAIARPVLLAGILLPIFLYATVGWTKQTERLLPSVFDTFVYAADATLGMDSFRVGRFLDTVQWFVPVAQIIYDYQWPFLMLLWVRQLRDPAPRSDFIATLLVVSALGVSLFYIFPVVGPVPAFADAFPSHPPPLGALRLVPVVALPERRNCLPSLHNAWAILTLWNARRYGWQLRLTTWLLVLVTILATLGFGYHYVLDIVVALPVALFASAVTTRGDAALQRVRLRALALGGGLTLGWLITLRYGTAALTHVPGLTWVLVASTVVSCLRIEHRMATMADVMAQTSTSTPRIMRPIDWRRANIYGLAIAVAWLGVTSLLTLAWRTSLEFGYTDDVLASFLVALLGGVALGALWGDTLSLTQSPRRARAAAWPLAAFALLSSSARAELLFLHDLFARLARGWDAGGASVRGLTMGIVGLVALPIGASLGALLPTLVASLAAHGVAASEAVRTIALTFGFGAALACMTTAFVAIPQFGSDLLMIVGGAALLLALGLVLGSSQAVPVASAGLVEVGVDSHGPSDARSWEIAPSLVLTWSGLLASLTALLAQQLLAVIVGDSLYTRTTTLGALALAASLGIVVAGRSTKQGPRHARRTQVGALFVLALGAGAMSGAHSIFAAYFASFAEYPLPQSFEEREFIRLAVAWVLVAPAVGAAAAVLTISGLRCLEDIGSQRPTLRRATAWTVLGAVLGVVLFGSVLVPVLGTRDTARLVSTLASAVGVLLLIRHDRQKATVGMLAGAGVLAGAFCLTREARVPASTGSEAYFRDSGVREVAIVGEGNAEGQVAVARSTSATQPSRLLMANGLRLGQGSPGGLSARDYAVLPLIHTEGRERAAVLGLDTGESSAALVDAGIQRLDIFEPAPDVVRAARGAFADLNDHLSERVNVRISLADGPTGLLLATASYDVIFVGGVAPWTPRAAPYGDVEFYRLAASRLAPGGVLLVALRTDHLEWEDLVSIVTTARQALSNVFVYARGDDAAVIACAGGCPATLSRGVDANEAAALQHTLALSDVDVDRVLGTLKAYGTDPLELVSTGDNGRQELSAPRAALLPDRPPGAVSAELRARAATMLVGPP